MIEPLAYTILGHGPGVVLVHGTSSSGVAGWGPVAKQLAADYTVVLPDLPGSGESPLPEGPLDLDTVTAQIVATAQHAGLSQFALAGVSLGAPVALKTAVGYPDRVSRLALLAGFARPQPAQRLSMELWSAMYARGDKDTGKLLAMLSFSDQFLAALPEAELKQIVDSVPAGFAAGTAAQIDLTLSIDVRADLPHVAAPTLVISPADDVFVSPVNSDQMAAGIPGARLRRVSGGHAGMLEDHREILKVLQEFLSAEA